jgi:hypothetical protein
MTRTGPFRALLQNQSTHTTPQHTTPQHINTQASSASTGVGRALTSFAGGDMWPSHIATFSAMNSALYAFFHVTPHNIVSEYYC